MEEKLKVSQILARRVREERKARGWTQSQLSEYINKTPETLCHIENGTSATKLSTIDSFTEIFGIEPYELFKEKDPLDLANITGVRLELLQELEETDEQTVSLVLEFIRKIRKKD